MLTFKPIGAASTIRVSLFRDGPGTNFDLLTFSFQVPRKGSAWASAEPEADKARTARVRIVNSRLVVVLFSSFHGDTRLENCSFTLDLVLPTNEAISFMSSSPIVTPWRVAGFLAAEVSEIWPRMIDPLA